MLGMLARQLPNSPKAEELPATVAMMVKDLNALGLHDFDSDRVSAAMTLVAIEIGKWPTSHMIKNNLPPRTRYHQKALENHYVPPEIRKDIEKRGLSKRENETPGEHVRRCLDVMKKSGNAGKKISEHLEKKMGQEMI